MKKYEINATESQLDNLYKALHTGSPLDIALTYSRINKTTYYFWLANACVARYCKEEDFLRMQQDDGNSLMAIREKLEEDNAEKTTSMGVGAFIDPTQEQILRYRNNKSYKKYCDQCAAIIDKCETMRSEIIMFHLSCVRDSAKQRGMNSMSSQWFLERACPNQFGRRDIGESSSSKEEARAFTVKFVDPNNKESQDRVKAMEALILNETKADIS